MQTIKVKVDKTETVEVEIKLPYFCKSGNYFFKVYTPDRCVKVVTKEDYTGPSIANTFSSIAFIHKDTEPCFEADFNEAFEQTLTELQYLTLTLETA